MRNFTERELEIAKGTDLVCVAQSLGYTPQRIGQYFTLKEMDSIRIYNHTHWFRWSRRYDKGSNGGSQIDFLRVFRNMEVKEAVFWLVDFAGVSRDIETVYGRKQTVLVNTADSSNQNTVKPFILPKKGNSNQYLYRYLNEKRGISIETIDYFVDKDLIYESEPYHNIVFKGKDKAGITKFASMRGVFDRNGRSFKCDVAGNDKNYGFNTYSEEAGELHVFEAAIDLMSYADMTADCEQNMIALGMLSDAPLITFLAEHPDIRRIVFHLDNDEPGRKAAEKLVMKYQQKSYDVLDVPPPFGYKDYNEMLLAEAGGVKSECKTR